MSEKNDNAGTGADGIPAIPAPPAPVAPAAPPAAPEPPAAAAPPAPAPAPAAADAAPPAPPAPVDAAPPAPTVPPADTGVPAIPSPDSFAAPVAPAAPVAAAPHPGYGQTPHPGYPAAQTVPPAQAPHPGYPTQAAHPGYPAQPAGPGQPVPPAGGAPKRGLGTKAILGIAGGAIALVLILVIALVVVPLVNRNANPLPSAVVESYLTALSESDAETALSLISTPPDDTTLLTDEALAASNELAPIGDIVVEEQTSDELDTTVVATYSIGSQAVTGEFSMVDYDDDGIWEISGGVGELGLSRFAGLGVTVNGQPVDVENASVFPGTYALALDSDRFILEGETTLTVTAPFEYPSVSDIVPALSETAVQEFRDLVRAAVTECIASTSLAAGCGLELPGTLSDGTVMADGTITRTLPANTSTTIDNLVPTLSYDNPTLAQGGSIGSVDTSGSCTKDGSSGTCSVLFGPSLGRPSIDMAAETPVVLWD